MPIYEYHCCRCKTTKEIIHGINVPSNHATLSCCGVAMEKQISTSNFRLKGEGFYKNEALKDKYLKYDR